MEPARPGSAVPSAGISVGRLLAASRRNLRARLIAAALVVVAALPLMPPAYAFGWFAVVLCVAALEVFVTAQAGDGGQARPGMARAQLTVRLLTSLVNVVGVWLFWRIDLPTAKLFGIIVVCMSSLYILMQYYARPRLLVLIASPYIAVVILGAGQVIKGHLAHHHPWLVVTSVTTVVYLLFVMWKAAEQLAASRLKLQKARHLAQEQGRAAQAASVAKSAFLATMSHEIRTPLNGVLGMAQVMATDPMTPVQQERLSIIRESGEALLAILNDVLDLSKIEAGRFELEILRFDLDDLAKGAHSTFSALAEKKGLSFDLTLTPAARGAYRGDPTRIRQILYNLISNAVKFTQAGGVRVEADYAGGVLAVAVADTGIGIPADRLASLFQKFMQVDASTTRQFGGTGLGLAISRHLAELMGGSIEVESVMGQGTTFHVRLQVEKEAGPAHTAPAAPQADAVLSDGPPPRLLAAEDNPVNQLVLKTLLGIAGMEAVMVENGEEALAAWRADPFDLVLMDMQMPVMDGLAAAQAIRAEEAAGGRARTPIIALTANAMSHQIAEYLAAGMDGHVAKPIEAAKLFAALEAALEGRTAESPTLARVG